MNASIFTKTSAADRRPYRHFVPLRPTPFEEDREWDQRRVELVNRRWSSQDDLLRMRDRQVEKNIRMVCGQQWTLWSPVLGKYVDIAYYLNDDERRWRQRPVVNRLILWYMLTLARLTENPPICAFQPASADHHDAELAEVMDVLFKTTWRHASMDQVVNELVGWMIPGGRAHLVSRIDWSRGPFQTWEGPAVMRLDRDDGSMIERAIDHAPYGPDGEPLLGTNEQGQVIPQGRPFAARMGEICADVMPCLQVRGQWGAMAWERKRWQIRQLYLTPEEVYDSYGVECEPDIRGDDTAGVAELNRILFGAGFFGGASNEPGSEGSYEDPEGFVTVREMWEAPCSFEGMEETPDYPGGRLLAVTPTKVLRDGTRYAPFPNVSPIRCFDFIKIPGRPQGSTPQEAMNPVQQTFNRGWAQMLELRNRCTNPILWYHKGSGLEGRDISNKPGLTVGLNAPDGKPPMGFIAPPGIPEELFKTQDVIQRQLDDIGNLPGAEGRPPTRDPSGELVKELRFNSDRYIQPTARSMVQEFARMVEDWRVMMPLIFDEDRVLNWTGEDNVARAVTVYPDLFELGKVDVVPDIESMLPEGRGERQARVEQMWLKGAFGPPDSPQAIRKYLELSRFPHLGRTTTPGGIDRVTAQQENGRMVRGETADQVVVLEFYDHAVHLDTHYEFMKSPEYLKLDLAIQQSFVDHCDDHRAVLQMQMMQQMEAEAAQAAMLEDDAAGEEGADDGAPAEESTTTEVA